MRKYIKGVILGMMVGLLVVPSFAGVKEVRDYSENNYVSYTTTEIKDVEVVNVIDDYLEIKGIVIKVVEMDGYNKILVEDPVSKDKIFLNVGEKTVVKNPLMSLDFNYGYIKEGDRVYSKYSPIMTKSLPAISNAFEVQVINNLERFEGKVEKVEKSGNILVSNGGFYLIPMENTLVVDKGNNSMKISELEVGDTIEAYHSMVMAMSYPGQTGVYKIVKK